MSPDPKTEPLTKEDAKMIVKETLIALGVDMENPIEFQADAQFVRKLRRTHERVGIKVIATGIGLIMTGSVTLLVIGFVSWIKMK